MEGISLTINDLKVRDKIDKKLAAIEIISIYNDIKGSLELRSSSFDFKGSFHQFDRIMESIYKYNKQPKKWEFQINGISVNFALG